jgi:hypothetical protein
MSIKRGEPKEDLKDRILNSLHLLDQEIFTQAVIKQNTDYAKKFNSNCNEIKRKIQHAPDYLKTSLNRQLERIREKAKKYNIIN